MPNTIRCILISSDQDLRETFSAACVGLTADSALHTSPAEYLRVSDQVVRSVVICGADCLEGGVDKDLRIMLGKLRDAACYTVALTPSDTTDDQVDELYLSGFDDVIPRVSDNDSMVASLRLLRHRFRNKERSEGAHNAEILSQVTVVPWEFDPGAKRFTYVSEAAEEAFGYRVEDWYGANFWQSHIHVDDRDETVSFCELAVQRGEDHELRYRFLHANGSYVWVRDFVSVQTGEGGQPTRLVGVFVDVSDDVARTLAESSRRKAAEEDLRKQLDLSPLAVIRFDADSRITEWSKGAERIFGWEDSEVIGMRTMEFEFVHVDDRERVKRTVQGIKSAPSNYVGVNRNYTKAGEILTCRWYVQSAHGPDGGFRSYLAIAEDITESSLAQGRLEDAVTRFETLFEASKQGILVTDMLGNIEDANAAAAEILAVKSADELRGVNVAKFVPKMHQKKHPEYIESYLKTGESVIVGTGREAVANRPDGGELPVHIFVQDMQLSGERKFVAFMYDLSERHRLEDQLRRAQRLEAIGSLASGVAHDFNNVLTPILSNAELIERSPQKPESVKNRATRIKKSAARARTVVRELLALSRTTPRTTRAIPTKTLLREIVDLLKGVIPSHVRLELAVKPDTLSVFGDFSQLHQAILNLVTNAYQAIGEQPGTIILKVRNASQPECTAHQLDRGVVIEIRDDGPGVPKELHSRIFDPFFTTKPQGQGSGLGLSMVFNIIKGHGGHVSVNSEAGGGTVMRLLLPAVGKSERITDRVTTAKGDQPAAKSKLHIALIEDEPDVAEAMQEMLEELDQTCVWYQNPSTFLKDALRDSSTLDLVISDQSMPNMTGLELADKLAKIDSSLTVVIFSGRGSELAGEAKKRENIYCVLNKPLTLRELEEFVATFADDRAKLALK